MPVKKLVVAAIGTIGDTRLLADYQVYRVYSTGRRGESICWNWLKRSKKIIDKCIACKHSRELFTKGEVDAPTYKHIAKMRKEERLDGRIAREERSSSITFSKEKEKE
ncbi:hypothetical protein V1478_008213 [Vespula squamosa]|uniref:Uncharacterized protein n=1 Tax=Vespula squamosa TaxID=30214 RepID=A0ABD2B0Q2_VESSQ